MSESIITGRKAVIRRDGNIIHLMPDRSWSDQELWEAIHSLDADQLREYIDTCRAGWPNGGSDAGNRFLEALEQRARSLEGGEPPRVPAPRKPACDCGRDAQGGPYPRVHSAKCAYVQPRPVRSLAVHPYFETQE